MQRILVTGGAGFIGSYLCKELLRMGYFVTCIDLSDGSKIEDIRENKNFRFIRDSILNSSMIEREIKRSDYVFHMAAIADPKRYVTEPLNTLNLDLKASIDIMEMSAYYNCKLAFASTSEIYGRNPNIPFKEDDLRVLGPTNVNRWCYSTSKAACEHYCYAYAQQQNLRFVTYRFFNIYGPLLDDLGQGRAMPMMLRNFFMDQPVEIHGDGLQTRCFTYVEDTISAVIDLAFNEKAEGQAFNIGTDVETTILDLAKLIKKIGNFKSDIIFIPHKEIYGDSYEDIQRRVPDVSKIKEYIGWEAKTPLEAGIRKVINYYKKQFINDF